MSLKSHPLKVALSLPAKGKNPTTTTTKPREPEEEAGSCCLFIHTRGVCALEERTSESPSPTYPPRPARAWKEGPGHRSCHFCWGINRTSGRQHVPLPFPRTSRKDYLCGRLKVRQQGPAHQLAAFPNELKKCGVCRGPGRPEAAPGPRRHICPEVPGREGTRRETCPSWCPGQLSGPFGFCSC